MDFQGTLNTVRRIFTDPVQHDRLGDHLGWILHQQFEDRIFCLRQADRLSVHLRRTRESVEADSAECEQAGCPGRGLPELYCDAGEQLGCVEGLGNIVICAAEQKLHFV